jgi:HK97 gp10 family phage protein
MSITPDLSKFQIEMLRVSEEVACAARKSIKTCAQVVIKKAREELNANFKSHKGGMAEKSIMVDDTRSNENQICIGLNATVAPYSIYLHEGTGIYGHKRKRLWREPVEKKALHWVSDKQSFFSKGHYIDGIEGHQFLYIALENKKKEIVYRISNDIETAIKKVVGS